MLDLSSEDITEGSLVRALLVLAGPLLVQNLVQVVQQVVDVFWLGRLSGDAVAAVGLAFPLLSLVFALVVFAPFVGTQVLVSQRVGRDDTEGAGRAYLAGLLAAVGLSLLFAVVLFAVARPLVELLLGTRPAGVAGRVPGLAASYLSVIALGLPVVLMSEPTEAAFVGWGDSRASLYINGLAVALNLVLDPFFIFDSVAGLDMGLGLGIEGAALASVVGYGGGALLGIGLIAAGRNGGMVPRAVLTAGPSRDDLRQLFDIGLPYAGQHLAKQAVDIVLVVVVFAAGGVAGLAAYTVGLRVASLAVIPASGLQQAAQSVVGQNLGAGHSSRARRTTWVGAGVATALLAALGLLQFLFRVPLSTALAPTLSGDALSLAVQYLTILAVGYPAIGATSLFQAGFNGARRTRTSFVASLVQYWGVRLPVAAVGGLVLAIGVTAVFWAVTASNVVAAIGLAVYYRAQTADGMLERAADRAAAD